MGRGSYPPSTFPSALCSAGEDGRGGGGGAVAIKEMECCAAALLGLCSSLCVRFGSEEEEEEQGKESGGAVRPAGTRCCQSSENRSGCWVEAPIQGPAHACLFEKGPPLFQLPTLSIV